MANHVEAEHLRATAHRGPLKWLWGAAATAACVLITAVLAPIAAILAALGKMHALTRLTGFWARLLIRVCGVTVELEGAQNLEGIPACVLVSNHQSFFDIFAIAAFIPREMRFVAKRELRWIPVIGYALARGDHIMIHRQAGGSAIRKAVEIARKGYSLSVFAEGHRFNDNRIHEFSDGGAWLAILAKLPVVPMSISGSGAFFPRRAVVVIPGGKMRMTIGKPIETIGLKSADRTELTRKLEEAVRATFEEEI